MSKHKAATPTAECPTCSRTMPANRVVCAQCRDELRSDLLDLAGRGHHATARIGELVGGASLLEQLELTRARQGVGGRGVGGRATVKPLPFDLRVGDTIAEVRAVLEDAAFAVLASPGSRDIGVSEWGSGSARDLAVFLLRHLDRLCATAAAPASVTAIRRAVAGARRLIDAPPPRSYLGQCLAERVDQDGEPLPLCDAHLWARHGERTVVCPVCRSTHDVAARQGWMAEVAADAAGTLAQIAKLTSVLGEPRTLKQLEGWVRRGQLRRIVDLTKREPRCPPGPAMYRIAHVRDIIIARTKSDEVTTQLIIERTNAVVREMAARTGGGPRPGRGDTQSVR